MSPSVPTMPVAVLRASLAAGVLSIAPIVIGFVARIHIDGRGLLILLRLARRDDGCDDVVGFRVAPCADKAVVAVVLIAVVDIAVIDVGIVVFIAHGRLLPVGGGISAGLRGRRVGKMAKNDDKGICDAKVESFHAYLP